ncbi:MAG: winged helix-turn-helix domain-containing protein [Rhodanobacteraceae bacterium]|nr:winged helix-turn-helix domain-containing protein [Rhodanobacteraceae bacterium]
MTQGIRGYRFGDFTLDLDTARLQRAGAEPVALRRLVLRVLTLLLENAPNLVSRDRLLDHAWGRQAVSDGVVAQVIKELRQLLGDNAQQPRYLETRPRQGYRILLPAEAILRAPAEAAGDGAAQPGTLAPAVIASGDPENAVSANRPRRWRAWQLAAAVLLLLLVGVALFWRPQSAGDPALAADALRMDWHRLVDRAPAELPLADARVAADALLARGDMAAVHALVAAQRPQARDAWERGLLDLIALRADGREHDALARVEALLALRPDDLPLRLLRAELEAAWRAPSRRAPPVTDPALPPERQLLQQARTAGAAGDAQAQHQHARAAIELAGERSPVLRELARIELGLALAKMGDSESADGAFARAQAALAEAGFHRLALAALLQRSALARRTGRATQVLPALEAEDPRVAERGDVAMRAELTRHRGILVGIGGDFATSLALLESAAAMFVDLGDHARASSALNASSGPLGRLGRNAEVPARLAEARRHAALSQHPESAAAIAGNLGLFHWRRGEIGAATGGMREALEHFERADRADDVAQARNNLATLMREAGEAAQALALRELAVSHARQAGLRSDLATRLYGLAEDLRARGDTSAR